MPILPRARPRGLRCCWFRNWRSAARWIEQIRCAVPQYSCEVAKRAASAIRPLRAVRTDADLSHVEAVDARGGGAPDPGDDGQEDHRRETGQYPDRGGVRQMWRAQPRAGGARRDAREIRVQELRSKAGDAVRSRVA